MTSGSEVVLTDPAPEEVRAAVRRCGRVAASELELAVTEVVANAHEHGQPPVEVIVRAGATRLSVTVRDGGPGPVPDGPPLGSPDHDAERGRGRWLVHQLVEVRERRTSAGYEVHLAVRG